MTAEVLPLNRAGRTAEEEHVRKSVRSLLAWNDMSVDDLSERTGIPRATLYKRMSTKPGPARSWLMKEVVDIGRVFGVSVSDLIDGTVSLTSATNRYRKDTAA